MGLRLVRPNSPMGMVPNKEENVGIYRRYIMYREGSTRYFVKKNRRGDISINIGDISVRIDISEIFWKNRLWWQNIGDISLIFWWYFPSFMQRDLTAQITPVLIWRPRCDSNGNMTIQRPDYSQFFIQRPKLIFNGKLMFQRLFWPKFIL